VSEDSASPVEVYAKANLANIVKRLKAGKTLTASERKALDEYEAKQAGEEWVKDTTALAKELGLGRRTIYEARERFPDEAPKKHPDGRKENIKEWRRFCAEKLIGRDTATKTLADLKAELMREQIELARAKNRRESGDVIDREVVEEMLGVLAQKLDLLLRLKLEVELGPRVAGKSAAEANVEGGAILEEIREVVAGNIANFQAEALAGTRDDEGDA
jgi:phage terminase Nu1 subunit (DNA packaging protein)